MTITRTFLLVIISIIWSFSALHAQQKTLLATDDYNVLYWSYPHQFEFVIPAECDSFNYEVIGASYDSISPRKIRLKVFVGSRKILFVTHCYSKDSTISDTTKFTASILPKPVVYLGETQLDENDMSQFNNWEIQNESEFIVIKERYMAINVTYTIIDWLIAINGKSIRGTGHKLSEDAQNALKGSKKGDSILFAVKYQCDQTRRTYSFASDMGGSYIVK